VQHSKQAETTPWPPALPPRLLQRDLSAIWRAWLAPYVYSNSIACSQQPCEPFCSVRVLPSTPSRLVSKFAKILSNTTILENLPQRICYHMQVRFQSVEDLEKHTQRLSETSRAWRKSDWVDPWGCSPVAGRRSRLWRLSWRASRSIAVEKVFMTKWIDKDGGWSIPSSKIPLQGFGVQSNMLNQTWAPHSVSLDWLNSWCLRIIQINLTSYYPRWTRISHS